MKVDFYILETTSNQKALFFACQLVEKIYKENQTIYIHASSLDEARRIDTLLWTYRDESFLPHELYDAALNDSFHSTTRDPILIGHANNQVMHHTNVYINLSSDQPNVDKEYSQLIEIVIADPNLQQLARERYKKYRDEACDLTTFKIKANEL